MTSRSPLKWMCGPSRTRSAFSHAFVIAVAALFLISGTSVRGRDEDTVYAPHSALRASTECSFVLPTAASVLDVLADGCCTALDEGQGEKGSCTPSASPLPTHPVLILFTDSGVVNSSSVDAIRAKTRQIAKDVPSSVLRVHEYVIPMSDTERRLIELLLVGASRLPALALFHGSVAKVHVTPGAVVASSPLQALKRYSRMPLASAGYLELRTWVLSELPTRYVDPVTFHLIPSLQFVFSPSEVRSTLKLVQDAVEANASRSVSPALVTMAYIRLTTHGSEEVLAALSSVAAQAGNAVLTLATESEEVAAAWGLRAEHTLATAPWRSAVAAYLNGSASASFVTAVSDLSPPQSIGTMNELADATSATAVWRAACAASAGAEVAQLQRWHKAMDAFNTTNPLRKVESSAHFLHELTALQSAMKIVFVLRESDVMRFHDHLDVAATLARRLRQTTVLYNTTTFTKGLKERSRVERAWTPFLRSEVFWLDAEQLPAVADGLHVSQVPSVLILLPVQSRFSHSGAADDDWAAAGSSEDAGLRSRDPLIGVHTINRYDIVKAAYMSEAPVTGDPVSGKDALPLFPSDCDALLRFLASGAFIDVVQRTMSPTRLSTLRSTAAESPATIQASKANDGIPNRRYLHLDRRYYPLLAEEEPLDGPSYVRQILNGSLRLPARSSDGSDPAGGRRRVGGWRDTHSRRTASAPPDEASGKTRQRLTREAAAALEKKAAWWADLAKRRLEKAERMRRKAAENAAERERQKQVFQQEVDAALKAEEGANVGGTWALQQDGLLVRRPKLDDSTERREGEKSNTRSAGLTSGGERDVKDAARRLRRRRRHQEYREWLDDRHRMVNRCVTVTEERELSVMSRWE
ncbi:hypothetical protein CUR178_05985 [Leishmania enriettii]|uniref:Uncharacterized protein n=1 Tax=Leishmania enriettii TaxID=5663 RepID=A0A836HT45_LEIEN|nr:hypothetical protein CUR178_05985 [Leishmania enriettii]